MTLSTHLLKDGDKNQIWNQKIRYKFKEYDMKLKIYQLDKAMDVVISFS